MKNILVIFIIIATVSCSKKREVVDYIYINAKVYTVDDKLTIAESFAVNKGKFIAVDTKHNILNNFTSKNIIDLKGKCVYPGLIDGHCHFLNYGLSLQYADLSDATSFDEVILKLKKHRQANPSIWLIGRGWDQNKWADKTIPDNKKLDELFPYFPVVIIRVDGHAVLANSLALTRAGITPDRNIEGGKIILKNKKLTGLLLDNAAYLMIERATKTDSREKTKALLDAQKKCFAVGLTTITEAGLDKKDIDIIDTLQVKGKLKMRIYAMINASAENLKYYFNAGSYKTPFLDLRSIKIYADGALGSGGALLLKPYSDDNKNYGITVEKSSDIMKICKEAYEKGFQVCTHAIGDSAVRNILNIYAYVLKDYNAKRWRIEHAQVVDPEDLPKFKKYSIIPSVQTCHATSDMHWAEQRLGPIRIKYAYAYKSLLAQNGWIINGTDSPVENINPIYNFYAAVTRKDIKGFPHKGFQIENALTKDEALQAMTIWAAKGCFEDREKGSIEQGKLADFIITDKDFMAVADKDIPSVKVIATYIGGTKVFGK